MFDSEKIREEISEALAGVRSSLAPGVLLRVHPNRVQDLAVKDDAGDVLILFPSDRAIENDRTLGANIQWREQKVLIVISLPTYYQELGAGKVAERVEAALQQVRCDRASWSLTFDSRREFFQQERWILEITFNLTGRKTVVELSGTVPTIANIGVSIIW